MLTCTRWNQVEGGTKPCDIPARRSRLRSRRFRSCRFRLGRSGLRGRSFATPGHQALCGSAACTNFRSKLRVFGKATKPSSGSAGSTMRTSLAATDRSCTGPQLLTINSDNPSQHRTRINNMMPNERKRALLSLHVEMKV